MLRALSITTVVGLALGCAGSADDPERFDEPAAPATEGAASGAAGGEDNTYDHPASIPDVWGLLDRMQAEGPPEYAARVHSCTKLRYATLGRLLASRGVDLAATAETSAGAMYRAADQSLGAANYGARAREGHELTTASASKLFDILVQAAPEIIANMPGQPACTVGGAGARMFNDAGQCTPDGIACLIGLPATAAHLELCNQIIGRASTPELGQSIAVASLLAAAHTCE